MVSFLGGWDHSLTSMTQPMPPEGIHTISETLFMLQGRR